MLVYPEQARALLCPFRSGKDGGSVCCVANDCMAWTWSANTGARGFCSMCNEPATTRMQDGQFPPNKTKRDTLLSPTKRTVAPPPAVSDPPCKPDVLDEIFAASAKRLTPMTEAEF